MAATGPQIIEGVAGGVPYLALPPATRRADAPVVITWHLMDPPRSPAAMAAALPLAGLDAWRIHLELPMTGARMPEGGPEALMAKGFEDAVLNLQGPIAQQGSADLAAAWPELVDQLRLGAPPVALLGGSMGSTVAQLATAETAPGLGIDLRALVLVSPAAQLRPVVAAMSAEFGVEYAWSPASEAVGDRLDFVARAGELAAAVPAVLIAVGGADQPDGFVAPAHALGEALTAAGADARVVELPGVAHALAEEPGLEAAPQTDAARAVETEVEPWLAARLR